MFDDQVSSASKKVANARKRKVKSESDDDDDKPIQTRKVAPKPRAKKGKKEGDVSGSDTPKPKRRATKIEKEKNDNAKAPVTRKKKEKEEQEQEEDEVFRWWDANAEGDDTVKWQTLEHNGVIFPPPYEPLPKHIKMKYNGMDCLDLQLLLSYPLCREGSRSSPSLRGSGRILRSNAADGASSGRHF